IRVILNTSADRDHTGGNARIAPAGRKTTGGNVAQALANSGEGADVYAHENVARRMNAPERGAGPVTAAALPTITFRSDYYKLQPFFNGEGVELFSRAGAHT